MIHFDVHGQIDPATGSALIESVLAGEGRAVLAVSGGADSLALLAFAGENRDRFASRGIDFLIATVDHGLRPEAAGEASHVAAVAAGYGLPHRTLSWDAGGCGNLSARARDARYRLLLDAARDFGAASVLTGHHQDDQIETHLMARARGEGTLRLAGMRPRRDLAPGIALCRPFLDVSKADLVSALAARRIAWAEDPTNRDPRYARVRWREVARALSTVDRLAVLSRISQAQAMRRQTELSIAELLPFVCVDADGAIAIDRHAMANAAPNAAAGLLSRALAGAGGESRRASGGEVERLLGRVRRPEGRVAATLGGCRVVAVKDRLDILREFGRHGPARVDIAAHGPIVFDERFDIERPGGWTSGRLVPLRALGKGGLRDAPLPVLLSEDGVPRAAHPAALPRLARGVLPLSCRERVSWKLMRDLPMVQDVIQIAAKASEPVGKEMTADYLPV